MAKSSKIDANHGKNDWSQYSTNIHILANLKTYNGNCHELPYSSYEPVILEKD